MRTPMLMSTALGALALSASLSPAAAAYNVCRSQLDGREYILCSEPCLSGDSLVAISPHDHPRCQSGGSGTLEDCGRYWTAWRNIGDATGSPCPRGCVRGRQVGIDTRSVGLFPPRPQAKYKFQCWRVSN